MFKFSIFPVCWCLFQQFVLLLRAARHIAAFLGPSIRQSASTAPNMCCDANEASTLQHHFLIEPFDLWLIPLISGTILPTEWFFFMSCKCVRVCVSVLLSLTTHPSQFAGWHLKGLPKKANLRSLSEAQNRQVRC